VSDESLAAEAARRRRELREEQARHEQTKAALLAANGLLLRAYLRERLQDPGDFLVFVGLGSVIDAEGRLLWEAVDARLTQLLAQKPHLALPENHSRSERPSSAVAFLLTGT